MSWAHGAQLGMGEVPEEVAAWTGLHAQGEELVTWTHTASRCASLGSLATGSRGHGMETPDDEGRARLWPLLQVLFLVPFPEQHHEPQSKSFGVLG